MFAELKEGSKIWTRLGAVSKDKGVSSVGDQLAVNNGVQLESPVESSENTVEGQREEQRKQSGGRRTEIAKEAEEGEAEAQRVMFIKIG